MPSKWTLSGTMVVAAVVVLLPTCGRRTPPPSLPPEALAALGGLKVSPSPPPVELFRWHFPDGCGTDYSARLADGTDVRLTLRGSLRHPESLPHVGSRPTLALEPFDNGRQVSVSQVSETRLPGGRVFRIAGGFYDFHEEIQPWTHIGSQPGLKLLFPPLPQRTYPGPELPWNLTAGTGLLDAKTRVDGWFTIGGNTTALVRARTPDGSLQGTYLVLGTGRLLWARVVVGGKRPGVLEARLVAACDGLSLEPAVEPAIWTKLAPGAAPLGALLAAEAAKAKKKSLAPFLYIGASDCEPCRAINRDRLDRRMLDALWGTYVVELDLDDWQPRQLKPFRFHAGVLPYFYELDGDGRGTGREVDGGAWMESVPVQMAPVLREFFAR